MESEDEAEVLSRKGAEVIVDHLVTEGVPYVVGLCGHGDLGLLDALFDRQDQITTISTHHEAVAGFMADAYYRVRHQPLATLTSCGPGSANLPVALGSALMDDSALLAITGNVPTSQFNRAPFQETGRLHQADFSSVVRPYVKRSFQATRPEQLPLMLRQAFSLMRQGRPGPVHLDVPLNVFMEETDVAPTDADVWRGEGTGHNGASSEDIDRVLDLLMEADRPILVAGSGVETFDAHAELLDFAVLFGVPVATSPLGKSAVDGRHRLALGSTGRNGTYQANRATREADLIVALGTRFDDRATSSWLPGYTYSIPPTRLVHVHVDPVELGRNYPPTVGIAASPKEVLRQLTAALKKREKSPETGRWLEQVTTWRDEWEGTIAPRRKSEDSPIRPERLLDDMRRILPDDGIILSDVGLHHNWIVQEWQATAPMTVLQSWGFASMGFGVAGVLGARLAAPDRPVVSVVGDGGFLMHPSVVATAVEYDMPAVWLVWNNGGFVSIRDQQELYFGPDRELATTFLNRTTGEPHHTDFAALAQSMGGEGTRVEHPSDFGSALETAIASGKPHVIDVIVDDSRGLPAVATWDLPPLPHPQPNFGWPDS